MLYMYIMFWIYIKAAMLVSQNDETVAMLVNQTIMWEVELFSFSFFFVIHTSYNTGTST